MEDTIIKYAVAQAAMEIAEMPTARAAGLRNRFKLETDTSYDNIHLMLLNLVWRKCIDILNEQFPEPDPLAAEKALLILRRKKLVTEPIAYKDSSFRIRMANGRYRAYKDVHDDVVAHACPWPTSHKCVIRISGSRFADFLIQFDAAIPEMEKLIPDIITRLEARKLEERKKVMEDEIKEMIIKSTINQYLKPLGITASFRIVDGDTVSLDLRQTLNAHLDVPFWQLAEKLQDTDAIKSSLQQSEEPKY